MSSVFLGVFVLYLLPQYKEIYKSKTRDLIQRLKQQQQNFSAREKVLHQRAEQAIFLTFLPKLYVRMHL